MSGETPAITVDLGSVNLGSFANSQTAGAGRAGYLIDLRTRHRYLRIVKRPTGQRK